MLKTYYTEKKTEKQYNLIKIYKLNIFIINKFYIIFKLQ